VISWLVSVSLKGACGLQETFGAWTGGLSSLSSRSLRARAVLRGQDWETKGAISMPRRASCLDGPARIPEGGAARW
jgi:hypothetical protein